MHTVSEGPGQAFGVTHPLPGAAALDKSVLGEVGHLCNACHQVVAKHNAAVRADREGRTVTQYERAPPANGGRTMPSSRQSEAASLVAAAGAGAADSTSRKRKSTSLVDEQGVDTRDRAPPAPPRARAARSTSRLSIR